MDQFGTNDQQQLNQQPTQGNDGMTWWFRFLIKGAAVLLGGLALVCGIFSTLSLGFSCIGAGLVLTFGAVLVLAFELPIVCSYIEFIRPLTKFSEGRPHYQKTAVYMVPPIVVLLMCQSFSSIIGSLCIFGVAALYFMLTVGKKAPIDEMRNSAMQGNGAGDDKMTGVVTSDPAAQPQYK